MSLARDDHDSVAWLFRAGTRQWRGDKMDVEANSLRRKQHDDNQTP